MHELFLVLTICLSTVGNAGLSADEIVERHLAARGGADRIRAVRSLVFSRGTYREGTYVGKGTAFMAFARPYYRVVGNPEDPNVSILEGYDGSPWEYYANPGVVLRTVGHAAGATRRGTYIDWRLGEFRTHGSTVVRGRDETIGDRPAYRLELTSRDGFRREVFIDQETFLLLADRYEAPVHAVGAAVQTEGRFGDWREVDGIRFPFRVSEVDRATGQELNSMTWGAIEVNRELPPSWFAPPLRARNRLQDLLERLFAARTDRVQVLWSYSDFRAVYPDVETRSGIQAIAAQMSKAGDHDAAIALLEANARDHAASSDAAFALGRAHAAAGRADDARRAYEEALRLDPSNTKAAEALGRRQ